MAVSSEGSAPPPAAAEPESFQIPVFDERAARRAVWRGVTRTAITAVLLALVGLVLLELVSGLWQKRGDREERFQAVAGLGFLVAHPGWLGEPSGCCNTDLTSMELFLDVQPRTASPVSQSTKAWLRLNILGRLVIDSIPVLPETPIDHALAGGRPEKSTTEALLSDLPGPVAATALVEFAAPLTSQQFEEVLERNGITDAPLSRSSPPIYLESPYPPFHIDGNRPMPEIGPARKLAWPDSSTAASEALGSPVPNADPLTQFQDWAAELDDGDDRNLGRLRLPTADEIKRLAENPRVYAFILDRASIQQLRSFLDDAAVRSVNVADVAFDLDASRTDG
jgi:hypothetical protein